MENTNKKINPLFTKENAEAIYVPDIVRQDLCTIIEEKLKKAGFYYRLAYRVKKPDSIVDKMILRNYGARCSKYEHRKLQDLIGVRIILYFDDDMAIVRKLIDSLFSEPGMWETTEANVYEFRAMKINGTFKLPTYLSKMIVNPELKDYVDDTFELQVRTNAFEGWHEIEHDLHYKGSAFNDKNETLSRRMNSILATLELCDDSLVKLIEDLGHQHYKDRNWEDMIRCHCRIKFSSEPLMSEIIDCFDADTDLAKLFFKSNRAALIENLWNRNSDVEVNHNVNEAVRILNELGPQDERVFEIFANRKKKIPSQKRKKFEPFKPLGRFPVFASGVVINNDEMTTEEAFDKSVGYIYSWVKNRMGEVFTDLPEEPASYDDEVPGYRILLKYDKEKRFFSEMTTHPDSNEANRIWISNASVEEQDGKLIFIVTNKFAEPVEKYRDPEIGLFSRPAFYGEIADNIGIYDVEKMRESAVIVEKDMLNELYDLLYSGRRHFPVIVFMVTDKSWADKFDIDYFAFLVGYYAHIRVIKDDELKSAFAKEYKLKDEQYHDCVMVFNPGEAPIISYKKDILETSYEVIKFDTKKYWNENGCRAFRRRLISDIREKIVENVDENVYLNGNSFKLAQVSEEWDICNENGEPTGFIIERADAMELGEGMFHKVVSIYCITPDEKILITQRSIAKSHPHRWEVTCGSVLAGESEREGAVRELKEETGLSITEKDLIPMYKYTDKKRHCVYYGYMIRVESDDIPIELEPDETDSYKFMPLDDFFEFAATDDFARSESERLEHFKNEIRGTIKDNIRDTNTK